MNICGLGICLGRFNADMDNCDLDELTESQEP